MASKRVILTLEQRVNVIKKLDAGRSCRAVAQETGCGKTQITRIKQDRHGIMRDWQSGGRATIKIKRRTTPYEELNCLVWEWFCIARSKELPVSGRLIQVCDTCMLVVFPISLQIKCKPLKTVLISFSILIILCDTVCMIT